MPRAAKSSYQEKFLGPMDFARKYRLWQWVSELPRAERSRKLNEMARVAGIKRRTLNTWIDAPADSGLVAPFDAMLAICVLLNKDSGTVLNTPAPAFPATHAIEA